MDTLKLSFEQLKKDNNLSGYLALLSMGLHRFDNGVLNYCRLIHVSAHSRFSGHAEKTGLKTEIRHKHFT